MVDDIMDESIKMVGGHTKFDAWFCLSYNLTDTQVKFEGGFIQRYNTCSIGDLKKANHIIRRFKES